MKLLIALIGGGLWAFFIALQLDRPDLAVKLVPEASQILVHGGFVVFLLWVVYVFSHREIRSSKSWWRHGPGIYLRNLVVISLGVVLLIFTCREVLNGVDPTGTRALW